MARTILAFLTTGLVVVSTRLSAEDAPARPTIRNSIGMIFVAVPAGKGVLGSPADEPGRAKDETRRAIEFADGFYIGRCEVTQRQYRRVMDANPSAFSAGGGFRRRVEKLDTSSFPVESVCWTEAVEFCRRLSALPEERAAGRVYRLPSEAEWEYAARAGSEAIWHFGDDAKRLDEYAWWGRGRAEQRPHKVAAKKPNVWGLYDMHGNVWEWCADARPTADEAGQPPRPQTENEENRLPTARAIRGGSWFSTLANCRSAARRFDPADVHEPDTGFRVVMEVASKSP